MPLAIGAATTGSTTLEAVDGVTVTLTLPATSGTVALTSQITASQWTTSGSDIYYTTGSVGIGNSSMGSFNSAYNNLVVGTGSGNEGLTIYAGSANSAYIGLKSAANTTFQGGWEYDFATNDLYTYINGTMRMRLDASGNLQFNSGYGSVATAYGCRAWVNFNGTGTVAIRASGNVSSITDNGVGNYTVNFTTAMPDANYATTVNTQGATTGSIVGEWGLYTSATNAFQAPTTSTFRITTWNSAVSGLADTAYVMASVFR